MVIYNMRIVSLFFTFTLLFSMATAFAQNKSISWNERGVLAYYKITGKTPDFQTMIMHTKEYQAMPPDIARQYLEEEKLRLQWGYGTFNPDKDFLSIKTKIISRILNKEEQYYLASNFPGKSAFDPPYFPYNLYDTWVALKLKDIADYMLLPLDKENHDRISGLLGEENPEHEITLEIKYRVKTGDPKPIELDGLQQHMMLGEIAQFTMLLPGFHQSRDKIIWEYIAPWYMDEDEQDLIKILESR